VRTPVRSGRFKKDVKRVGTRGKDMSKLKSVLSLLIAGDPIPPEYHDLRSKGIGKGFVMFRDLHIEPDWLLLYRIEGDELQLSRTGSHADIFDE
jgi:mRNA interferase YafQ